MTPPPDQPIEATVEQLEPCPFCGERCANLVTDQGDKWAHYEPSCLEVRTGYDLSAAAPWRAEAIAAWNRRTSPPVVDGQLRIASRAIHEHLSRRDIMQYLDNDEDCEGVARAVIAAIRSGDKAEGEGA